MKPGFKSTNVDIQPRFVQADSRDTIPGPLGCVPLGISLSLGLGPMFPPALFFSFFGLFFFVGGQKSVFFKTNIYFLHWKIIALQNFVGFFTFVNLQEEWTKTPQDGCPVGVRSAEEGGQQGDGALKLEQCQVWVPRKLCCCHKTWTLEKLTESQLPSQGLPRAVQPRDQKSGLRSAQASVIEAKLIPEDVYSHSCVQSKGDIYACIYVCMSTHTHRHSHQESNCVQSETHRQDRVPLYCRKYHSDYQASPESNFADYQDFLLVLLVMLSIFLVQAVYSILPLVENEGWDT